MPVPTYDGLFNPLLRAMRELGGSASVAEQEDKVAQQLNLSEKEASEIHRGTRSKLSYRLAWPRNWRVRQSRKFRLSETEPSRYRRDVDSVLIIGGGPAGMRAD